MEANQDLILRETDFQRISSMIGGATEEVQEFLQTELDRAKVVPDDQLPVDVVAMNTTVTFLDLATNKTNQVTLVYPFDANIAENKISVLAPVGAALIGLRVGQTIKWPLPGGKEKELKVVNVTREDEKVSQSVTS